MRVKYPHAFVTCNSFRNPRPWIIHVYMYVCMRDQKFRIKRLYLFRLPLRFDNKPPYKWYVDVCRNFYSEYDRYVLPSNLQRIIDIVHSRIPSIIIYNIVNTQLSVNRYRWNVMKNEKCRRTNTESRTIWNGKFRKKQLDWIKREKICGIWRNLQ